MLKIWLLAHAILNIYFLGVGMLLLCVWVVFVWGPQCGDFPNTMHELTLVCCWMVWVDPNSAALIFLEVVGLLWRLFHLWWHFLYILFPIHLTCLLLCFLLPPPCEPILLPTSAFCKPISFSSPIPLHRRGMVFRAPLLEFELWVGIRLLLLLGGFSLERNYLICKITQFPQMWLHSHSTCHTGLLSSLH